MPLVRYQRKSPVLLWSRWLLLAIGIGCLGFVSYSVLDTKVFQAYEDWQFSRQLARMEPSAMVDMQGKAAAALFREAPVARGSALGRMEISRLGIEVIVVEGTDVRSLRRAVGHLSGTALPGERGNVAIAGHRDTFFRELRNIRLNDEVTLTTLAGSYRYQVDWMKVVSPEDTTALKDSPDAVLTLVTCYPFYFVGPSPKRFVVRAHKL